MSRHLIVGHSGACDCAGVTAPAAGAAAPNPPKPVKPPVAAPPAAAAPKAPNPPVAAPVVAGAPKDPNPPPVAVPLAAGAPKAPKPPVVAGAEAPKPPKPPVAGLAAVAAPNAAPVVAPNPPAAAPNPPAAVPVAAGAPKDPNPPPVLVAAGVLPNAGAAAGAPNEAAGAAPALAPNPKPAAAPVLAPSPNDILDLSLGYDVSVPRRWGLSGETPGRMNPPAARETGKCTGNFVFPFFPSAHLRGARHSRVQNGQSPSPGSAAHCGCERGVCTAARWPELPAFRVAALRAVSVCRRRACASALP